MDEHADTKGDNSTTSYAQLEFIWEILKQKNKRKLIPNVLLSARHFGNSLRAQIIVEYFASAKGPKRELSPACKWVHRHGI